MKAYGLSSAALLLLAFGGIGEEKGETDLKPVNMHAPVLTTNRNGNGQQGYHNNHSIINIAVYPSVEKVPSTKRYFIDLIHYRPGTRQHKRRVNLRRGGR